MLKRTCALIALFLISNAMAAPTSLDCQTSNSFEQNLNEIEKATTAAMDDCPAPTKTQFNTVCEEIYHRKEAQSPNLSYTYQEELWKISCADPNKDTTEIAKTKIQNMWNKNRENFRCYDYPTSAASDKNVTKFSLDTGFSAFIIESIKKYKLDMNFKDPSDQKTILDFVEERKIFFQNSQPVDTNRVNEYSRIYSILSTNGAKHAKDL